MQKDKDHFEEEREFSFKSLFVPLTTLKAIHWIVIIGFLVYGNMLFNSFVWDDKIYIIFNPVIHTIDFLTLIKENLFNSGGQYRPIPALYFASLYALFNTTTFFYHVLQLIVHILNSILVYILFKEFLNKNISILLALVFLVHPIQVESVSYISSSGNTLFFFFGITALLLSMKKHLSLKRIYIIFCLLLLSILTKETGLLFLLLFLSQRILSKKQQIKILLFFSSILLLIYLIIRFEIGEVSLTKLELIPIANLSFIERVLHIPAIVFYYLKTFFYPVELAISQYWILKNLDFYNFYLPLIISAIFFLGIVFFSIYIFRGKNIWFSKVIFFFIWFILGLGLHIQLFPLDATVADRWFYFPSVGLLGLIGLGIQTSKLYSKKNRLILIIAIILIVLLSVRTIVRNMDWSDPILLYTHDRELNTNFDLENNLSSEYLAIGNYEKAIEHAENSVSLFPYEVNLYNLGNIYEQIGNIDKAKEYYEKAFESYHFLPIEQNHISLVYIRLAYVMLQTDEYENAKNVVNKGLHEYPDNGYLWAELAVIEYKLRNQTEALAAADKARILLPIEQFNDLYIKILEKQEVDLKL